MKFINYIFFYSLLFLKINFSFDVKNIINNKIEYFKKNPKKSIFFLIAGLMEFENLTRKKCCIGGGCKYLCPVGVVLKIPFINNIIFLYDLVKEKNNEKYFIKNIKKIDIFLLNLPVVGNYQYIKKLKNYMKNKST